MLFSKSIMPSPEKIEFFNKNKATLESLIERENTRRTAQGFEELSEEDFDAAMDDIMFWVEGGNRITSYKFNLPKKPVQAPAPAKKEPPQAASLPLSGKSLQCTIQECANGFMIAIQSGGEVKQYIFKSPKELMNVFSEVLFKVPVPEARQELTESPSASIEIKTPKAIKNELKAIRTH